MDKSSSHINPEDWVPNPFLSEESPQEPLLPNEEKDSDASLVVADGCDASLVAADGCDASLVVADGCDASLVAADGCDASLVAADGCDASLVVADGCDASLVVADGCDASLVVADGCDASLVAADGCDASLVVADGCDASLVAADGCDDILFLCDDAEAEYGEIRDDENWESGFPRHNQIPRGMLVNGELPESKRLKPQNSRRSYSRDYCAPGFYLITATTFPGSPALSSMPNIDFSELKKGEMIIPTHSQLGELIRKEISDISSFHPELKIIRFVIMPDHIHFVLEVRTRLKRKLGRILAPFFGACSKHYMALCGLPELKTLFQPFNDRIIYNYPQLDRAIKYVEDNPRRLIIKRKFPDLFRRYLHLEIAGHEYSAYGNIFLLKGISLLPVRIHRRWSEQEFAEYKNKCKIEISQGAIPISPAIHKIEKEIINYAIEAGGSVILLRDQGFEERFKPNGRKFDLCAEGRLLMLAPWQNNTGRKSTSGYTEFHKMNDLALAISTLPSNSRLSLKSFPRT